MWHLIASNKGSAIYALMTAFIIMQVNVFLSCVVTAPLLNIRYLYQPVVILLLFVMVVRFSKNGMSIDFAGIKWAFLIFVYMVVRIILGYDDSASNKEIGMQLLRVYFLFLLIINLFKTKKDFALLSLFIVIMSYVNNILYLSNFDIMGMEFNTIRIQSEEFFDININSISYMTVFMFVSFAYYYRNDEKQMSIILLLFILISTGYILTVNASRGAAIILLISIVLLRLNPIKATLLLSLVMLFYIFIWVNYSYFPSIEQFIVRAQGTMALEDSKRLLLTNIALDVFSNNMLFGTSYGKVIIDNTSNHIYYLDILLSYGIIGFLMCTGLWVDIFPLRACLSSKFSLIFLAFLVVYLFLSPPNLFISGLMAFFYNEVRVNKTPRKVSSFPGSRL